MKINELKLDLIHKLKPGEQWKVLSSNFNKITEVVNFIRLNCSEFLQTAAQTKKFLYRGIRNEKREIFMGYPRENRPSIEGEYKTSRAKIADSYLQAAGFKALRSNSIFCNSSEYKAGCWGETYLIFPINGFSFGYSKIRTGCTASEYIFPYQQDDDEDNDFKGQAEYFIDKNDMKNTDLDWAMVKNQDVWIHGPYIAMLEKYNTDFPKIIQ